MNKRIQELAKQSGFDAVSMVAFDIKEDLEKFAELIVGECAGIAREVGNDTEPDDWALDKCFEIENKIKKRFGVEE
jgi:hypothetical protein